MEYRSHLSLHPRSGYLMPKMPHTCKNHRDAMFVSGGNDFVVLDRAARLNDRFGAAFGSLIQAIAKWIKSIGSYRRSFEIESMGGGAQHGNLGRVNAAHLAGADAEHLIRGSENNGVGFYVTAYAPS